MGNLHKNIQVMLEFRKASFLIIHISYYTLMTFLMKRIIAICGDDTNLYSKCNQASDLWDQLQLASER